MGINTTGATPAATNMLEVLNPSTTNNSVAIYSSHTGAITGTGYGIWVEKTGASTTNIGGYYTATGATNNYALIVPSGGGNVGIGTTTPSSKAILDLTSTTQGVLVPRMTASQRDAIVSPATSLLVYVTDASPAGFYFYSGSAWVPLVSTISNNTSVATTLTYGGQTIMIHNADYNSCGNLQWDTNGAPVATGATSTTDGEANTATIVAALGSAGQAAYYCDTLTALGYTDWYLPSLTELDFMATNALSLVGYPCSGAIQYWSSTETAASNANSVLSQKYAILGARYVWVAIEASESKSSGRKVRCIRK